MPTFRLISDLHTELWPENFHRGTRAIDRLLPPQAEDPATILLLAGDTGSHRRKNIYKAVIDRLCDRFLAVIDIPGNHFWYGKGDWDACAAPVGRENYAFGHTVVAHGVVAATLWTDFRGDPEAEGLCEKGMNDFRQVSELTPALVKERHAAQLQFLKERVRPGSVVMTHFAPSPRSLPPERQDEDTAAYYACDLEQFILERRPAVWVHGHIHTACDYQLGSTRILCNPAGYYGRDHKPDLRFDV